MPWSLSTARLTRSTRQTDAAERCSPRAGAVRPVHVGCRGWNYRGRDEELYMCLNDDCEAFAPRNARTLRWQLA